MSSMEGQNPTNHQQAPGSGLEKAEVKLISNPDN